MRFYIPLLILLATILLASTIPVESQRVSSTNIQITYDPLAKSGIVVYDIYFEQPATTPVNLTVTLIPGSNMTILNVTSLEGVPLLYYYDNQSNTLSTLLNNTSGVVITYLAGDLMTMLVPGSYYMTLDTTSIPGAVSIDINIPGLYNASCIGLKCSTTLDFSSNITKIHVEGKGSLIMTLTLYTPYTLPVTTATPTTSSTTSTTSLGATTTPQYTTSTTQVPGTVQSPGIQISTLPVNLLITIVAVLLVGAVIILLLVRKRA
uniref:Uncharacterized protein n=1 Tax=Thermogladius calderae TaxID=1200300 RepID=A0A7J3Y116_9CREN